MTRLGKGRRKRRQREIDSARGQWRKEEVRQRRPGWKWES